MKATRTVWREFPEVILHAPETRVKKHAAYAAAKSGDAAAAVALVRDALHPDAVDGLRRLLGGEDPLLVSVHAQEETGVNAIPEAFAGALAVALGLRTETRIVQANVVNHTGADGYSRLARPAFFAGDAEAGQRYVMVDDFVGQGGTLANLRGHIESQGGEVLAAVALTGKPYSATITLSTDQLARLRSRHGALEDWWQRHFGYGFDCLTQSEARYLERAENADVIRDRILAAQQAAGGGEGQTPAGGVRGCGKAGPSSGVEIKG